MRKIIATAMLILFVISAFVPFVSHNIQHAIHDTSTIYHHTYDHSNHFQVKNNKPSYLKLNTHHDHAIDTVSFYKNFPHIELCHIKSIPLRLQSLDFSSFKPQQILPLAKTFALAPIRTNILANYINHPFDSSSLFLSTLRLRL